MAAYILLNRAVPWAVTNVLEPAEGVGCNESQNNVLKILDTDISVFSACLQQQTAAWNLNDFIANMV